jgi:hypothetical protein
MKRLLLAVLIGIAFSAAQLGLFFLPLPPVSMIAFSFLNLGSMWACVGMVTGGLMRSWKASVLTGALALLAAVWSYYLLSWVLAPRMAFPFFPLAAWSLAALVAGPFAGIVGGLSQRTDKWSLVPWVAGPLLVVVETAHSVIQGQNPDDVWLLLAACVLTIASVAFGRSRPIRGIEYDAQADPQSTFSNIKRESPEPLAGRR